MFCAEFKIFMQHTAFLLRPKLVPLKSVSLLLFSRTWFPCLAQRTHADYTLLQRDRYPKCSSGVNNSLLQCALSKGLTWTIFHSEICFYHLSEPLDSRAQEHIFTGLTRTSPPCGPGGLSQVRCAQALPLEEQEDAPCVHSCSGALPLASVHFSIHVAERLTYPFLILARSIACEAKWVTQQSLNGKVLLGWSCEGKMGIEIGHVLLIRIGCLQLALWTQSSVAARNPIFPSLTFPKYTHFSVVLFYLQTGNKYFHLNSSCNYVKFTFKPKSLEVGFILLTIQVY